jgi:hypothetical protein
MKESSVFLNDLLLTTSTKISILTYFSSLYELVLTLITLLEYSVMSIEPFTTYYNYQNKYFYVSTFLLSY